MDNSHKLWPALTGYQEDDAVTIDNNAVKIQMPPWAYDRSKWLFAQFVARSSDHEPGPPTVRMKGHADEASEQFGQMLPHQWMSG